MSQPVQNLRDRGQFLPGRQAGPVDHQDWHAQRPRGVQLGARAGAAGVFRNHQFGGVAFHQRKIALNRERPARDDNIGVWQRHIVRFVNQPQQIVMLGLRGKILQVHPAHSQKDAPSGACQCCNGRRNVRNMLPAVVVLRNPGRSGQRNQRNTCGFAGGDGIPAHLRGKGMRCVHDMRDRVVADIAVQSVGPSEPADAHRQRLRARIVHTPGVRVDCAHPPFGKAAGQCIGFGRAAKKQEVGHD